MPDSSLSDDLRCYDITIIKDCCLFDESNTLSARILLAYVTYIWRTF